MGKIEVVCNLCNSVFKNVKFAPTNEYTCECGTVVVIKTEDKVNEKNCMACGGIRDKNIKYFPIGMRRCRCVDNEVESKNCHFDYFTKILGEMAEIHARKNADYGNSFDKSLDEDGLLVAKIRLGDKYSRFSSLINKEQRVNDESMEDTLIDMANYAVMTVKWMRDKRLKEQQESDGNA